MCRLEGPLGFFFKFDSPSEALDAPIFKGGDLRPLSQSRSLLLLFLLLFPFLFQLLLVVHHRFLEKKTRTDSESNKTLIKLLQDT